MHPLPFLVILLLATLSYKLNTSTCLTSNSYSPIAPSTLKTTLSTAAQHFIEIIAQDPLLASEARLLQAGTLQLWADYPFNYADISTSNETNEPLTISNPRTFESSFYTLWVELLDTVNSLPHEILALLSSHAADLAVLDAATNNYLFESFLVTNPVANLLSGNNCWPLISRFLPPLLPLHYFTRSHHRSAATLISAYLPILNAHTAHLHALTSLFNTLTTQLSNVTQHTHALITSTIPPLDPDLAIDSTNTLIYNGTTIPWTSLSFSTREKIILWEQFSWAARAIPTRAFGAYPSLLLDGWRTRENPVKETQKYEFWGPKSRVVWMRVRFLEGLVREGVERVEVVRGKVEEVIRRVKKQGEEERGHEFDVFEKSEGNI